MQFKYIYSIMHLFSTFNIIIIAIINGILRLLKRQKLCYWILFLSNFYPPFLIMFMRMNFGITFVQVNNSQC
jgi:hypothetical protein